MKRLFHFHVCLTVFFILSSCSFFGEKKIQNNSQESDTIEVLPDSVKKRIVAQDSLMNELVSIIDTLTLELNISKDNIAKLENSVEGKDNPKSIWRVVSLAAIVISVIALVLPLLKSKRRKEDIVKEIVNQMLEESGKITNLQTKVNTLSQSQQFDSKTLRDIGFRLQKVEMQVQKVRSDEKDSSRPLQLQPQPHSASSVSQGKKELEYHRNGYAKVDTDTYFTTIFDSNQEGCVFKIDFTSQNEGKYNIISLDKIKSRNDWQQKVECTGVSINDASDFRVEEYGLCEKIDENTWKVTKPLKINLIK